MVRNFSTDAFDAVHEMLSLENYRCFRERTAAIRNFAVYEIPNLLDGILRNHGFRPPAPER